MIEKSYTEKGLIFKYTIKVDRHCFQLVLPFVLGIFLSEFRWYGAGERKLFQCYATAAVPEKKTFNAPHKHAH